MSRSRHSLAVMFGAAALTLALAAGTGFSFDEIAANRAPAAPRAAGGAQMLDRPWGPEQMTGEPDVPAAADDGRAWASATPDGQDEWIELRYNTPVNASDVLIHETFNPGAVSAVFVTDDQGRRFRVFKGRDPSAGSDIAVLVVTLPKPIRVVAVRIELASTQFPGWNEIDAVGLVDAATGKVSWADAAKAGTTYADPRGGAAAPAQPAELDRLRRENEALRRLLLEQFQRPAVPDNGPPI